MDSIISAPAFSVVLVIGLIISMELGRRLGTQKTGEHSNAKEVDLSLLEGALFGLFSLLVAFTFYGAASRFDSRRMLIVEEANAIGTAYLRLDLLPPTSQQELRSLFRRYIDQRLLVSRALPDIEKAKKAMDDATQLQGEIWSLAVAATRADGAPPSAPVVVLPAINEMIDITATRTMAARTHPPKIIYLLLLLLALICAGLTGHRVGSLRTRPRGHKILLVIVLTIISFVTLDLEYPRAGFIRPDLYDQALIDVRDSMK